MKSSNSLSLAIFCLFGCSIIPTTLANTSGGNFELLFDDIADGFSFEQRWENPANWRLIDGVDDGNDGIPSGNDTITMDRNLATSSSNSDLALRISPNSIAKITGTAAAGRDIVFKLADFTLGDLELRTSPETFVINLERDRDLVINGVISGPSNLEISRFGAFLGPPDRAVTPDEVILFTGSSPNTITGEIRLLNSNIAAYLEGQQRQPSYWVADKVGAFGEAAKLVLEGTDGINGRQAVRSGVAQLRITSNAIGGEGAIDDQATDVFLGVFAELNVDAGVNEAIPNLYVDLDGTGSYTQVQPGTYDNTQPWLTGEGTVTVLIPEPATLWLVGFGVVLWLALFRSHRLNLLN